MDRSVRPKFRKHIKEAPDNLQFWERRLNTGEAHLAELTAARGAGLAVDDAENRAGSAG